MSLSNKRDDSRVFKAARALAERALAPTQSLPSTRMHPPGRASHRKHGFIVLSWVALAGMLGGVLAGLLTHANLQAVRQAPMQAHPPAATDMPGRQATMILAQDTFQRADQLLWGIATDGERWTGDAVDPAFASNFAITNQRGVITASTQRSGTFNALLGPTSANVTVEIEGALTHFDGTANFGAVVRFQDRHHFYKAYIDGRSLVILKVAGQHSMVIGTFPFAAQDHMLYTLLFVANDVSLEAAVWPITMAPPPNMLFVRDASFTAGRVGIRVLLDRTTQIVTISSFLASSASTSSSVGQ